MRSILKVLSLAVALLIPSISHAACVEVKAGTGDAASLIVSQKGTRVAKRQQIRTNTAALMPVVVHLVMPKDDDTVVRMGRFGLWFQGHVSIPRGMYSDAFNMVHCTFVRGVTVGPKEQKMTRFTIFGTPVREYATADTFTLRSGFYLPKAFVDAKPKVDTELDAGAFEGQWSYETDPKLKKRYAVLTLRKVD